MNIIVIVTDTFRWDYIGAYGNSWIRTPNLDRLAGESAVFEDAYAEGLPTIPARRVLMTGRNIVPFSYRPQKSDGVQLHGWHPLYDEDVTLAEHLREHDYVSAFFNDVYHMMKPGKNFHRGFDCWHWIRGQEDDGYRLRDRKRVTEMLERAHMADLGDRTWMIQHLVNRSLWKSDADTCVAMTMRGAAGWLKDYTLDNPFYLHVETFDPHEPWDPPVEFPRMYDPDFKEQSGMVTFWGDGPVEEAGKNARTAYAGNVTLVDKWVGHLLDAVAETGHLEDTLIVFTSDHGAMMGEQGEYHKGATRLRNQCTKLPLFMRHPAGEAAGSRVGGLVQHQDIMPTVLSVAGLPIPDRVLGRNAWPQALGREPGADAAVSAFGPYACYRTEKWNYICPWADVSYDTEPRRDLYDLEADPEEVNNVIADHPDVVSELAGKLEVHLKDYAPLTAGELQALGPGQAEMSFNALPRLA